MCVQPQSLNGTLQPQICAPFGASCSTSNDCYGMPYAYSCVQGVCVQCQSSADCPTVNGIKQSCVVESGNSKCMNTCSGCASNQEICINGMNCCAGVTEAKACNSSSDCSGSTSYCVNGYCNCEQGQLFDGCTTNGDCASNNCLENNICGFEEAHCLLNSIQTGSGNVDVSFDPNGYICLIETDSSNNNNNSNNTTSNNNNNNNGSSSTVNTYCVGGECQTSSLGAYCGPLPDGLGTNISCGPFMFCVNNYCSETPGWVGDLCMKTSDCMVVEGNPNSQTSFVCCPESGGFGVCRSTC